MSPAFSKKLAIHDEDKGDNGLTISCQFDVNRSNQKTRSRSLSPAKRIYEGLKKSVEVFDQILKSLIILRYGCDMDIGPARYGVQTKTSTHHHPFEGGLRRSQRVIDGL